MPWYRLYHLNDGRIFAAEDLEADDDPGAMRQAAARSESNATELWLGTARIASFSGTDPAAAPPVPIL